MKRLTSDKLKRGGFMQKTNYQRKLDGVLCEIEKSGVKPRLLLHCCCAPCSSYVFEYLCRYFDITVCYYNPNISPESEYNHRLDELRRLAAEMPQASGVKFCRAEYDNEAFLKIARGHEKDKEGGERCFACYRLRLEYTAEKAKLEKFDYFTTTLSISPMKNAEWLNSIGAELEKEYGVKYLYSDFKKREGYKRSIQLSGEYSLYRQDYCGCVYSRIQRKNEKKAKETEKTAVKQ